MESVNFKKTTLTFLASHIPEDQIDSLRQAFIKMDKNGDGHLSKAELVEGSAQIKDCQLTEKDWDLALKLMDLNGNGVIDYTEFIAGCLQSYDYVKESNLKHAFAYFDKDNSGTISKEELKECLSSDELLIEDEDIEKIIAEVDLDKDGQIDYKEFIQMMKTNKTMAGFLQN